MYVGATGHLFIERRHPIYPHVIDFLISCCEPVSRTEHVEEYRLDSSSLSAASAEGTYSTDMIRNILQHFRQDEKTGGEGPLDLQKLVALDAWAASQEAEQDPTSCPLLEPKPPLPTRPPPPRGLKLTLNRSASVSPGPQPTAGAEGDAASPSMAERPLVSLALRDADWQPAPLPPAMEAALAEEEGSSKMRIVLQPRLRRFAADSEGSHATQTGKDAGTGTDTDMEEEDLYYFVVSSDRAHLEKVIASSAQAYLEPVLLHGSPRWILSDVDKGVEELQAEAESGRPAALRRLYATGACTPAAGSNNGVKTGRVAAGGGGGGPLLRPTSRFVYKTQVKSGKLRNLKECLFRQFGVRADCFYDHLQDPTLHVANLTLARNVRLRPYQTASLERFQRGGKAHQGVVVLPCGAGKTLTGIGAAAIMQKRTIVMCINNMSVFQWQREFLRWTNLTEEEVTVCTAKEKARPGKVFITTYSMLVAKRGRAIGAVARESEEILRLVRGQTWGLLLLDEVHTALAHHFQEVLNQLRYKCVLGLSATLLREDDRIADLRHLVGPKLYEANWLDLTRAGYLAKVECAEVQCPMPATFFAKYCAGLAGEETADAAGGRRGRRAGDDAENEGNDDDDEDGEDGEAGEDGVGRKRSRRRRGGINALAHNMAASNPYKLWCTQALLEFHRNRSPPDKVIIFCDYLADVRFYAYHLHLPFMDQRTSESERRNLLRYFQFSDTVNAIVLTRVGDVALDLPCASVIIQISGLGASRRQEAQRLGRILRPKPPSLDNTCSYFYTLVSQDTHEVKTGYGRQSWLRDQGFAYRVLRCDQVLSEFARLGGVRCCIGPPQWWFQVPSSSSSSSSSFSSSSAGKLVGAAVAHDGQWWSPFSREASVRLHYVFSRGKPTCTLEGNTHLGSGTPRPTADQLGGLVVGAQESWSVQFSSADAPRTFGTVLIGEAPLADEGQAQARVRRVTFGEFRQPHNCLSEESPCVRFALAGLGATVDDDD